MALLVRWLLVGACLGVASDARAQVRPLVAQELLRFGGLSDDPDHDLVGVRRVVRAPGGRFVIATTTPLAVKVHDPRGSFVRQLGRAGEGPGEFRGGVDLGGLENDGIWLLSTGTRRWMLFGFDGRLQRELPVDSMHPMPDAGVSLANGYYTRHLLRGSRGCVRVTAGMTDPGPLVFLETLTDAEGRTWRRDAGNPALWLVGSLGDPAERAVQLPPGITIHQFIGDTIVGVVADENDADHVVVLRVSLPPSRHPRPADCAFAEAPSAGVFRNLAIHARNALVAGMVYQSEARRFPPRLDEMRNYLNITEEARMTTLHASESSWAYAVSHVETGAVCVSSIGPRGLPGWEPGVVACDRLRGTRGRQ
ncbi:MAG TPA: hypothetical protein PLL69_02905 [Gemmatimonadales bacterium]|nr:hypothetical protein [Gemmatimonadales bacterium]